MDVDEISGIFSRLLSMSVCNLVRFDWIWGDGWAWAVMCAPLSAFLVVSGCIFIRLCHHPCLSGLPFSLYLHHSVGLSSFASSSFLILFISGRDAPQRHSAELSDLNKCLWLERGLSCGLGCCCRSRCSSHSAAPLRLNESLSKPPSLLRLSHSVCGIYF